MLTDELHHELTAEFIMANPVTITLMRGSRTPDGRGGWQVSAPVPVGTITGRLVGERPTLRVNRTSIEGVATAPTLRLVLLADTDIMVDDTFKVDDDWYEVTEISKTPPWRIDAGVTRQ